MASWDEASRCPKCGNTGVANGTKPVRRENRQKATLHILKCMNPLCVWTGTNFHVQVNEDGSIPDPISPLLRHQNKQFPVGLSKQVVDERIQKMNDRAAEFNEEAERQGRMS
jgi:hypothetical protein